MRRQEQRIVRALQRQMAALLAEVPGLREGDADAIHDARVATRRIRAIVPVAYSPSSSSDTADGLNRDIRKLGRALGRARDLDVALDQLCDSERRLPASAASPDAAGSPDANATALLRQSLRVERDAMRRRLIKTLEALPVDQASADAAAERARPARARLRSGLEDRARGLQEAMEHACGVYFPNRLHQVRIELKKLRYLIELADKVGAWRQAHRLLQDMRDVQDILGTLHDREVLLSHLPAMDANATSDLAPLRQLVEAERDDLFQQYLSRRADLEAVAGAAMNFATHQSRWRGRVRQRVATGAVIASAITVAGFAIYLRYLRPLRTADIPGRGGIRYAR